MTRLLKALAPVALLGVAACSTGFDAKVSRFNQLPAAQGQTFYVTSDNARLQGGLEFAGYANLVADRLARHGYVRTDNPTAANLTVKVDYFVDAGQNRTRVTPGSFSRPWGWGPYGYGYGGWGWAHRGWYGRPYMMGWYDPFMFDDYDRVESYTVYQSQLNMTIEQNANRQRLFEGRAQALSTDNELTSLVPNLVEAMFTNFPGRSGETVRITVAPEGKTRRYR